MSNLTLPFEHPRHFGAVLQSLNLREAALPAGQRVAYATDAYYYETDKFGGHDMYAEVVTIAHHGTPIIQYAEVEGRAMWRFLYHPGGAASRTTTFRMNRMSPAGYSVNTTTEHWRGHKYRQTGVSYSVNGVPKYSTVDSLVPADWEGDATWLPFDPQDTTIGKCDNKRFHALCAVGDPAIFPNLNPAQ